MNTSDYRVVPLVYESVAATVHANHYAFLHDCSCPSAARTVEPLTTSDYLAPSHSELPRSRDIGM